MGRVEELLKAGNAGGAWLAAEALEGRTIPYPEFIRKYLWKEEI